MRVPYRKIFRLLLVISVLMMIWSLLGWKYNHETAQLEYTAEEEPLSQLSGNLPNHTARKANDLIDMIGVVTHLTYSSYGNVDFNSVIKARLTDLGIRHIRDTNVSQDGTSGGTTGTYAYSGQLKSLSAAGIHITPSTYYQIFNTDSNGCQGNGNSWDEIPVYTCDTQNRFVRKVKALIQGGTLNGTVIQGPNSVDAFAGLNEPDHVAGLTDGNWSANFDNVHPDWVSRVVNYSHDLRTALSSDSVTAGVPIIAPSFVHLTVFPLNELNALGEVKNYVDKGNAHVYCHNRPPVNCISTLFTPWQSLFSPKPMVLTELGYHNVNGSGQATATSETNTAKYLLQSLGQYFNLGVERIFIYELKDEGGTDRQTSFGLLKTDGSPKPAYNALKNFLTILNDTTANFSPGTLAYSLDNTGAENHALLLQKKSGEFYLMLWADQGNRQVRLNLEQSKALSLYKPTASANTATTTTATQLEFNVSDEPTIVKIAAASSGDGSGGGGTSGGSGGSNNNKTNNQTSKNNKTNSQGTNGSTTTTTTTSDTGNTAQTTDSGTVDLPKTNLVTEVSGLSARIRVGVAGALVFLAVILIDWLIHHRRRRRYQP